MTKEIYLIKTDADTYQYFLPEDIEEISKLSTNCKSKKDIWLPPSVFIYEPFLEKGDFYQAGFDYLISSPRATAILRNHFEMAGEVLPLPYNDEIYSFVNILRCYDCLNKDETIWKPSLLPEKYVFKVNRLPYPGLFKIPETHTGEILVLVDTSAPASDNFKATIERNNIRGLVFDKLWEHE